MILSSPHFSLSSNFLCSLAEAGAMKQIKRLLRCLSLVSRQAASSMLTWAPTHQGDCHGQSQNRNAEDCTGRGRDSDTSGNLAHQHRSAVCGWEQPSRRSCERAGALIAVSSQVPCATDANKRRAKLPGWHKIPQNGLGRDTQNKLYKPSSNMWSKCVLATRWSDPGSLGYHSQNAAIRCSFS